jgi:hypothetical protein
MRGVIAVLISTSVFVFPMRLHASIASPVALIKSESQYRAEASRYDGAVRAIAGILTMKLETTDDLKAALNIVEQQRQNLKFYRSKLAILALSNSTFSNAIKRRISTKDAATALIASLSTDRQKVSTIAGFDEVKTQIQNSAAADAAVLRRASERLKTAADKVKTASHVDGGSEVRLMRASFNPADENATVTTPQDPATLLVAVVGIGFWVVVIIAVVAYGVGVVGNANTEEGRDAVADCQDRADQNYAQCVSTSLFGKLMCAATLLAEQALCLAFPDQVR